MRLYALSSCGSLFLAAAALPPGTVAAEDAPQIPLTREFAIFVVLYRAIWWSHS